MGADNKMTNQPHYFVLWGEDEGADCTGCYLQRIITFDNREDCQAFIENVHKREGYEAGSLRVLTGYELEIERK